jgi:hypothetical protein
VADDQGSSEPRRSNTSKLDEESLNGVPICFASAKEATAAGKSEIRKRHESASTASRILREERNNASHTSGGRHRAPEHNREDAKRGNRGNHVQNLDSSFLSRDESGNIVPKTPRAALVAAHAYILTTQPTLGNPRESMHQAAIKCLGLIGDKLNQEEIP